MIGAIVGWSGLSHDTASGGAALAAMFRASASADRTEHAGAVDARLGPTHALGRVMARGRRRPDDGRDRDVWCAIDGHPRWSERRLSDLARDEGDLVALVDGFARYDVDVVRCLSGRY